MTVEASPLPFKHQDYTLSALLLPPPFLSPHDAGTPRRRPSGTESEPSQLLVFYAYSLFFRAQLIFLTGRYGEIAVAFVGGRAPPTYSDWTTGLGVRGSRWELYFGEASPSPTRLGGRDYNSHDAPGAGWVGTALLVVMLV